MAQAQGRGSAAVVTATAVLIIFYASTAEAATYTVGDDRGWTSNVTGWTRGKNFKAGDILVFNYNNKHDLVVEVYHADYTSCATPHGGLVYADGNDHIKLAKGDSFFISNIPEHCEAGTKIAVHAT